MRYSTANIIKDENGRRRFSSLIIPIIPTNNDDVFIQTTSRERLDKLAHTFYSDASLWWVIASANGLGKGSIVVPPNTKLRIPSNKNIQEITAKLNLER